MIDETPYIIVDNRKIPPVGRSSPAPPAAGRTDPRQEPDFGVVDRVTISREGLEKSRLTAEAAEEPPLVERTVKPLTGSPHPMLTYTPARR